MSWFDKHLEPTATHFSFFLIPGFLLVYALFSHFIRNRLHLSEPPLATIFGIIFGPRGIGLIDPESWGSADNVTQEAARVIVGLQVFSVGVELPKMWFSRHWKSVAMMLGPVMTFSWLITAAFVYAILHTKFTTALIISACLSPTDPVLAAAVLAESTFSIRVPARLKHMLSAESGCNDGTSFPFLYIGLLFLLEETKTDAAKEWVLGTVLWQCALGLAIGLVIGQGFNWILRLVERRDYISREGFLVFYLLLAILSVGIASSLGVDDFLLAFGAGYGFAWDGWFKKKMKQTELPGIIDLIFNSSMFIYLGAIIPWERFSPTPLTENITVGRLFALLILVLLFRRIPIVLAIKPFIQDVHTWSEALFVGHFGPMGLGALFLVMEARAQLENGTSLPEPYPPLDCPNKEQILTIWPVVCFIILGSTMVHGLSPAALALVSHFRRKEGERAPLLAQETDALGGMVHDLGNGDSEPSVSGDESD